MRRPFRKTALASILFAGALLAVAVTVEAQQQTKKFSQIGFLVSGSPSTVSDRIEIVRQGLRDLGYVEGKNILIKYRYAEEKPERLSALAAELVREKVEVIVTVGTNPLKLQDALQTQFPSL